ncbi:MAG: chromosomal replication initiator protein DnaA [Acidimicrobiales bacterium]
MENEITGRRNPYVLDPDELWKLCSDLLREQVSDATWMANFDSVEAKSFDGSELVLTTLSSQVRDKLEHKYRPLIEDAVHEVSGHDVAVTLLIRRSMPVADASDEPLAPRLGGDRSNVAGPRAGRRVPADSGGDPGEAVSARGDVLNDRYCFDAFVIGDSNRFAHAAAQRVAESPATEFNPLFVYGDSGLGKTHLLHAIGNYVREQFPSFLVRYVSTEKFMNEFVDSIRSNSGMEFKRRYRACDVLLVDDIQFMENKESLQEEFFHTFNTLHESGKQIVLTSDRPPRSIATLDDRMRSRFESGLTTDIQPPELETRLAILRKKAAGERPRVPDEVLDLIATHIRTNIRELEGSLIRVCAWASLNREPLTLEAAETILADVLAADKPREITAKVILEATAATFGFTIDELKGTSRRRPLVNARQISMYVMRDMTDFSYPAIAREFGGRDHTTVIHAVDKISRLMAERRQVYDQATQLMQRVRSGG